MKDLPDKCFDLAVVDPPYRDENQPTKDMRKAGSMKSLEGRPSINYWESLYKVSKERIVWGANNFQLPQFKGFIVWEKGIPMDFTMSMAEIASLSDGVGTISKIVRINVQGQNRIHPTQKPTRLYEWILKNYAKPGQTILDTHGGSMSSVIAALNMGFEITCIEKDEDYFNAAVERVIKSQQQQKLF